MWLKVNSVDKIKKSENQFEFAVLPRAISNKRDGVKIFANLANSILLKQNPYGALPAEAVCHGRAINHKSAACGHCRLLSCSGFLFVLFFFFSSSIQKHFLRHQNSQQKDLLKFSCWYRGWFSSYLNKAVGNALHVSKADLFGKGQFLGRAF